MTEKLLQYIWQFQLFNRQALTTIAGEELRIIHQGILNRNQGPDFLEGRISIGPITFAGSIELHLKTSDWHKHHHGTDDNYRNVILHVVYQHDQDCTPHPTIELQARIAGVLLEHYQKLMQATSTFPCAGCLGTVPELRLRAWKERLIAERLIRKSERIFQCQKDNGDHWEETLWWLIARHFGTAVNADAFERVARSLPLKIIARHRGNSEQLEALLLGQAGLLKNTIEDDYGRALQREYAFLQKKWNLPPLPGSVHFLRMRPANFPTLRLAQLAVLLLTIQHLFSKVVESDHIDDMGECIRVTAGDYWKNHYCFDTLSANREKRVGTVLLNNVLVNAIIPVLFAYGSERQEEKYIQKALRWLEALPPEQNSVVSAFSELRLSAENAFDSQALLELKTNYCDQKGCLRCALGYEILKNR